jgi:hypothetical protein
VKLLPNQTLSETLVFAVVVVVVTVLLLVGVVVILLVVFKLPA